MDAEAGGQPSSRFEGTAKLLRIVSQTNGYLLGYWLLATSPRPSEARGTRGRGTFPKRRPQKPRHDGPRQIRIPAAHTADCVTPPPRVGWVHNVPCCHLRARKEDIGIGNARPTPGRRIRFSRQATTGFPGVLLVLLSVGAHERELMP